MPELQLYKEEFLEAGIIRKGHGYKGHAKIIIFEGLEKDLLDQKFLFLEISGYKVPFYIEEKTYKKEPILKFQFIDSLEELKRYQNTSVFILKKDIKHASEEFIKKDAKSLLVGLSMHDEKAGILGPIIRIDEYPQQDMAVLLINEKEILIPLHPSLIVEILENEKVIKMDLPEGLI